MPDSKRKTIIESIREYVRMYPDIDNRKINIDYLGDGMEYSIAAIQKAMADREMQIEQMKADAANAKKKVNTPNAAANQAPSGRPLPKFNMLGI